MPECDASNPNAELIDRLRRLADWLGSPEAPAVDSVEICLRTGSHPNAPDEMSRVRRAMGDEGELDYDGQRIRVQREFGPRVKVYADARAEQLPSSWRRDAMAARPRPIGRGMVTRTPRGDRRLSGGRPRARRRMASRDGPDDPDLPDGLSERPEKLLLILHSPVVMAGQLSRHSLRHSTSPPMKGPPLCPHKKRDPNWFRRGVRRSWPPGLEPAPWPATGASAPSCGRRSGCISSLQTKGRLAAGPSRLLPVLAAAMSIHHNRRLQDGPSHRRPAVARVSAGTLRMLEAAIGPGSTPALRQLARQQIADLLEVARWKAIDLPADDRSAAS